MSDYGMNFCAVHSQYYTFGATCQLCPVHSVTTISVLSPMPVAAPDARDEQITALSAQLEADRTKVAECAVAINRIVNSWAWLTEGRGSHEWNDDRYREEFGSAISDIKAALAPLWKIAADWTGCPQTSAEVAKARIDLEAQISRLTAERDAALADKERYTTPRPKDEWHEDYSCALWWRFPICEPPYCGDPGCSDWPFSDDDEVWWTPMVDANAIHHAIDAARSGGAR